MDNNYFEMLADSIQGSDQRSKESVSKSDMAFLTVKVDIDCKLYCDGDFLELIEANKVKKIPIEVGQHLITIESENVEGVSEDRELSIEESGKNHLLVIKDLHAKEEEVTRLAEEKKLAEEQERETAELKRKEEEERQRIAAEQKKKEEDEQRRKAAEIKKKEEEERQRIAAEQKKKEEDEQRRKAAEIKKKEDEERQRIANERKRKEEDERLFLDDYCTISYVTTNNQMLDATVFGIPIKQHISNLKNGYKVVFESPIYEIPNNAFSSERQGNVLLYITVPKNVTSIGDKVFEGQSNLQKFSYCSDRIVSIGKAAFKDCKSLKYFMHVANDGVFRVNGVELNKVSSIGTEAFSGCSNIYSSIHFKSLNILPSSCFKGCKKLQRVNLDSITEIYSSCFEGCSSLSDVTIGANISKIDTHAFANCANIKEIEFRSGICPLIHPDAFNNCSDFRVILRPDSQKDGFKSCTPLQNKKMYVSIAGMNQPIQ